MPTALITGVSGQDGFYLAHFLLKKGYTVHGLDHRPFSFTSAVDDTLAANPRFTFHLGAAKRYWLLPLLQATRPDEIYNLAAQSHVQLSSQVRSYTSAGIRVAASSLLDLSRELDIRARFYEASSSEMFGASPPRQNENTPFLPRSEYALAKLHAHQYTVMCREQFGMFATNGILFNHESPRRGELFVTRKIAKAVARIHAGLQSELHLGNLDAVRDWGYAPEYVEAMWLMLQQDKPDDFVIATGEGYTVREFCEMAFACVGLDPNRYIRIDKNLQRPNEVPALIGDASKAERTLGWRAKVRAPELVKIMVDAEVKAIQNAPARDARPRQPVHATNDPSPASLRKLAATATKLYVTRSSIRDTVDKCVDKIAAEAKSVDALDRDWGTTGRIVRANINEEMMMINFLIWETFFLQRRRVSQKNWERYDSYDPLSLMMLNKRAEEVVVTTTPGTPEHHAYSAAVTYTEMLLSIEPAHPSLARSNSRFLALVN